MWQSGPSCWANKRKQKYDREKNKLKFSVAECAIKRENDGKIPRARPKSDHPKVLHPHVLLTVDALLYARFSLCEISLSPVWPDLKTVRGGADALEHRRQVGLGCWRKLDNDLGSSVCFDSTSR